MLLLKHQFIKHLGLVSGVRIPSVNTHIYIYIYITYIHIYIYIYTCICIHIMCICICIYSRVYIYIYIYIHIIYHTIHLYMYWAKWPDFAQTAPNPSASSEMDVSSVLITEHGYILDNSLTKWTFAALSGATPGLRSGARACVRARACACVRVRARAQPQPGLQLGAVVYI